MGQSIDCQPHFGHQVGRRKASYANHEAQVEEKTVVCLLSDRLLADQNKERCQILGITFARASRK